MRVGRPRKTKYTMKDFYKLQRDYEKVFWKLVKYRGMPQQKKYIAKERRLSAKERLIRRDVGLRIADPCPAHASHHCKECSGYYRDVYKGKNKRFKVCEEYDEGAIVCTFKGRGYEGLELKDVIQGGD